MKQHGRHTRLPMNALRGRPAALRRKQPELG